MEAMGHRNDVQGLRAVAVLLVVLGHAGVGFLRGGFVGVDVFFVLSGFLITRLLIAGAERDGSVSLRAFYARRAKRILPAAALTLVAIDLASYHLMNFVRAKQAVVDSLWAALFSANVHFARVGVDYFAQGQPPSPVQHFWSLAVEEQFYLLWPLVLAILLAGVGARRRNGRLAAALLLIGIVSLTWSVLDTGRTPAAAYFSTAARAWELVLGAALAVASARFLRLSARGRALLGWGGIMAIGVAAVLFSDATPFPGYAALLPTVGTAMVIAAGIGDERSPRGVGGPLGCRPLRYVGDRSYAFYLWHWPVLAIAASWVGHDLSLGVNLILLGGAFLLSVLSFRLVEDPIRRATFTRPLRTSALLWGTSVVLVAVVAAASLRSIDGIAAAGAVDAAGPLPTLAPLVPAGYRGVASDPGGGSAATSGAIPAVVDAVRAARRAEAIPTGLVPPVGRLLGDQYQFADPDCFAQHGMSSQGLCRMGTGARTIVVFGDSHARQWMPAILSMASTDGWSVVPLIETGCRPAEYLEGCNAYYRWAIAQVRRLHPDVVLIGGHLRSITRDLAEQSVAGFGLLIDAVKPLARQVVVIGDPPSQEREPVDCLLGRGATLATCARTLTQDQASEYAGLQRIVQVRRVGFIDTMGWFCFEGTCPLVVGRTITHRDTDHVTMSYVLELRELFRSAFSQALGPASAEQPGARPVPRLGSAGGGVKG
jgi:peptidoglycan/LPS O-acetylase OafA/YrhL